MVSNIIVVNFVLQSVFELRYCHTSATIRCDNRRKNAVLSSSAVSLPASVGALVTSAVVDCKVDDVSFCDKPICTQCTPHISVPHTVHSRSIQLRTCNAVLSITTFQTKPVLTIVTMLASLFCLVLVFSCSASAFTRNKVVITLAVTYM